MVIEWWGLDVPKKISITDIIIGKTLVSSIKHTNSYQLDVINI